MSLNGKMNTIVNDLTRAMRNASMNGVMDSEGGINGTRKVVGYVCHVYGMDDEDEDRRGTVDVQEYGYDIDEDKYEGAGHHERVLCAAIQNNQAGVYIMPSMYSNVMIMQDPVSLEEYVMMCSHVDIIQLQSHQSVKIGVIETEEFKEAEDEDDIPLALEELPETGNAAYTDYNKEKIVHTVKTKDGEITITQTADKVNIVAKDTSICIGTDGKVEMSAKDVAITGTASIKTTSPKTTIDGSSVEVTGSSFVRKGTANVDGQGGFCGIPVCPFTGAIHTGSTIVGG